MAAEAASLVSDGHHSRAIAAGRRSCGGGRSAGGGPTPTPKARATSFFAAEAASLVSDGHSRCRALPSSEPAAEAASLVSDGHFWPGVTQATVPEAAEA